MNDCSPVASELRGALVEATEEANSWRGRCVNLFARGEAAIGAALLRREPNKTIPMLLGQKAQRLRAALPTSESEDTLDAFVMLLADRTALTHGNGKIWIRDACAWILTLDVIGRKGLDRRSFTCDEADEFHKVLRTAVQRLEAQFR